MKLYPVISVFVLVSCLLPASILLAQNSRVTITEFGARDGTGHLNTTAIQLAIDKVAENGGGQVIVPAGRFITGLIELRSGVELQLMEGAVLEGSDKRADYDGRKKPALIVAFGQHNIALTGKGTIDGKGRELMKDIFKRLEEGTLTDPDWKVKRPTERTRTNLVYFEDCSNVTVRGLTFKDATSWVTHYERCRKVVIDSIRLESTAYWNNDGVDIVDCRNVQVTNSFINAADDAICLKSASRNDFCDSIYIANCTLRSSASAVKLGTGSVGGFRNIMVRDIKVFDTYRSAIALEAVDGGFLENVDVRNVIATNTGNAIFIKLGHRNKDSVYSRVRNISIRDMKVQVPAGKPDRGYEMEGPVLRYPPGISPVNGRLNSISPWNYSYKDPSAIEYKHNVFPSSVGGLPGHPVENVSIENVEIIYEGGGSKDVNYFPLDSLEQITEAEKDYPEFSMYGELPVWGFFVRHVKGISFKGIRITNKKPDHRVSILLSDVENARLHDVLVESEPMDPSLYLHDVKQLSRKNITAPGKLKIHR